MSNSQTWVAYDAISGDVLADGFEKEIRKYLNGAEEATGGQHTVVIASEAGWRRFVAAGGLGMSGNPPRRNPPGVEHL
jgi:hypothetical protein